MPNRRQVEGCHSHGLPHHLFIEVTQTGKLLTGNTTGRVEGSKRRIAKEHTTPQPILRVVKAYGAATSGAPWPASS